MVGSPPGCTRGWPFFPFGRASPPPCRVTRQSFFFSVPLAVVSVGEIISFLSFPSDGRRTPSTFGGNKGTVCSYWEEGPPLPSFSFPYQEGDRVSFFYPLQFCVCDVAALPPQQDASASFFIVPTLKYADARETCPFSFFFDGRIFFHLCLFVTGALVFFSTKLPFPPPDKVSLFGGGFLRHLFRRKYVLLLLCRRFPRPVFSR